MVLPTARIRMDQRRRRWWRRDLHRRGVRRQWWHWESVMLQVADGEGDELQHVRVCLRGEQMPGDLAWQSRRLIVALYSGILGHGVERHVRNDAGEPRGFLVGVRADELEGPGHEAFWGEGRDVVRLLGVGGVFLDEVVFALHGPVEILQLPHGDAGREPKDS